MTQRSILAGAHQTIIIKAGGSVTVKGHDSELVTAETKGRWGLTLERRSESQIGRARAAIGEHVLFDIRLKKPPAPLRLPQFSPKMGEEKKGGEEVIEVQLGGNGEVRVPFDSTLKVYAGMNIDIQDIRGQVNAYSGLKLNLQDVYRVDHASAGGSMSLDCETMLGDKVEFKAGGDLRFHIRDLNSADIRVKDIGGYWEARIGDGEKSVYLKCGGDVTLVTDQKVEPLPPNYILGKVEKPSVT
jgi:hypothetical protein